MARKIQLSIYHSSPSTKRPGVHSKNRHTKQKNGKYYKGTMYRGQGRQDNNLKTIIMKKVKAKRLLKKGSKASKKVLRAVYKKK